jgi:hypothetical protein
LRLEYLALVFGDPAKSHALSTVAHVETSAVTISVIIADLLVRAPRVHAPTKPHEQARTRLSTGRPEGQAERLAYYEARKLNHLPNSLLDYNDVIRGRETPAERRACEGRTTSRGQ